MIVGFSYGLGLFYIGQLSNVTCPTDSENKTNASMPFTMQAEDNQFKDISNTLKVVFWSLFEPGHPEVVGCADGVTWLVSMIVWGMYQVLAFTLLVQNSTHLSMITNV